MAERALGRRDLLLAGAAAACAGCTSAPPRKSELAPAPVRVGDQIGPVQKGNGLNLVLIVSDTFRADYLGCYGNTWVQTPNIDALAREATSLTAATPAPSLPCPCAPTS